MRKLLCAALGAALLLSGCAGSDSSEAAPVKTDEAQPGEPWYDGGRETVAKAGDATACKAPITFDTAADWAPKPLELDGSEFDALLKKGDATMVCEVEGKLAQKIAFLRIYTAPGEAKAALEAFLAEGKGNEQIVYRDRQSGAVEATFIAKTELEPEGKRLYATAVKAGEGAAVLSLEGFMSDDAYGEYVLARDTLTVLPGQPQ